MRGQGGAGKSCLGGAARSGGQAAPGQPLPLAARRQPQTCQLPRSPAPAPACASPCRPPGDSGTIVVSLPPQRVQHDGTVGAPDAAAPEPAQPARPRSYDVRYARVMDALRWLCANNPLYADVSIVPPPPAAAGTAADRAPVQPAPGAPAASQPPGTTGADPGFDNLAPDTRNLTHSVMLPADPTTAVDALRRQVDPTGAQPLAASLQFQLQRTDGAPVSFHTQRSLEALNFVDLYPTGTNHWGTNRDPGVQLSMYLRTRCMGEDSRFCYPPYLVWATTAFQYNQVGGAGRGGRGGAGPAARLHSQPTLGRSAAALKQPAQLARRLPPPLAAAVQRGGRGRAAAAGRRDRGPGPAGRPRRRQPGGRPGTRQHVLGLHALHPRHRRLLARRGERPVCHAGPAGPSLLVHDPQRQRSALGRPGCGGALPQPGAQHDR